jgi:hypothetical protein
VTVWRLTGEMRAAAVGEAGDAWGKMLGARESRSAMEQCVSVPSRRSREQLAAWRAFQGLTVYATPSGLSELQRVSARRREE